MTDLVIGRSGPLSSLIVSRLKRSGRPYMLVGRELGNGANSLDHAVSLRLFGTEFENVFFLISSLKVDNQQLTESGINALPEVRVVREFLPLIRYKRLIYFSSAGAVYGPRPREVIEESDVLTPISAYGIVKAYLERTILRELSGSIGKKIILRIANPFGIYDNVLFDYGLLPVLIRNTLRCVPTRIVVPLEYRKDYFPISLVGDVIEAIIEDRLGPGIFNVASGYSRSIQEVCNAVGSALGFSPHIIISLDNQYIDADSGIISTDRLNKAVDFKKNNSFEEELRQLILYIQKEFYDA